MSFPQSINGKGTIMWRSVVIAVVLVAGLASVGRAAPDEDEALIARLTELVKDKEAKLGQRANACAALGKLGNKATPPHAARMMTRRRERTDAGKSSGAVEKKGRGPTEREKSRGRSAAKKRERARKKTNPTPIKMNC